ncbi:MAG: ABC transporter permease [Myxococcales bacterium]|nr:ABC transporter permease [Myxococcales bacterium]
MKAWHHLALGGLVVLLGVGAAGACFTFDQLTWMLVAWALVPVGLLELAWGASRSGSVRGTRTRYGALPAFYVFAATAQLGSVIALGVLWPEVVMWGASGGPILLLPAAHVLLVAVTVVLAILTVRRGATLQPGMKGRGRLQLAALVTMLSLALQHLPLLLMVVGAGAAITSGFSFTYSLDEARLALAGDLQNALPWLALASGVTIVADLVLRASLWYLLPERFRFYFWLLFDAALTVGFAVATFTLPLQPLGPEPEALVDPVIRLSLTAAFALRVFVRILPLLMQGLEATSFELLVASRHLRAKKSGFLATIGGLSILAVAVSTAMLVGVLSVMGGFRNDLKQKILGNQAHIVVDLERRTFEGWGPLIEQIERVPHVEGVTPFVTGEVMVTSATNMAGAVLRGIDPATVGRVTDLERNLTRGRLDYLVHPERMLDLPPEERRSILPLDGPNDTRGLLDEIANEINDELARQRTPGPTPPREVPPPSEGLREALGTDLDEFLVDRPARTPTTQPAADVLPGIIVGKELARSLRVYPGDEIDVISPLGELGPAGPMPKSRRYRVAGVFYSGMYEFDMKLVYVLLESGQRFLSTGDAVSGIEVKVSNVDRAPEVATAIRRSLVESGRDDLRVQDWQELNRGLFGALALEKLAMFVTLGIAVLIAGFCVFGTLTLMVQEKSREVGILFAMGTTRSAIVRVFIVEGLLIGLYGAVLGLGLGYLVTFVFEHFGFRLNPEVYYIDRLPVNVDPVEFTAVGLVALGVCVVSTIFPAVLASRLRPVDALRLD